jgi:hypothetical protein
MFRYPSNHSFELFVNCYFYLDSSPYIFKFRPKYSVFVGHGPKLRPENRIWRFETVLRKPLARLCHRLFDNRVTFCDKHFNFETHVRRLVSFWCSTKLINKYVCYRILIVIFTTNIKKKLIYTTWYLHKRNKERKK